MGYYDEVKKNVRREAQDNEASSDSSKPSFSKLKEAAQETEPDEEEGDDTEIEVVDEGLERNKNTSGSRSGNSGTSGSSPGGNPLTGSSESEGQTGSESSVNFGEVAEKLDRIIEQNERMIEILESFGS